MNQNLYINIPFVHFLLFCDNAGATNYLNFFLLFILLWSYRNLYPKITKLVQWVRVTS